MIGYVHTAYISRFLTSTGCPSSDLTTSVPLFAVLAVCHAANRKMISDRFGVLGRAGVPRKWTDDGG